MSLKEKFKVVVLLFSKPCVTWFKASILDLPSAPFVLIKSFNKISTGIVISLLHPLYPPPFPPPHSSLPSSFPKSPFLTITLAFYSLASIAVVPTFIPFICSLGRYSLCLILHQNAAFNSLFSTRKQCHRCVLAFVIHQQVLRGAIRAQQANSNNGQTDKEALGQFPSLNITNNSVTLHCKSKS